jgi:MoxR-like ATPase
MNVPNGHFVEAVRKRVAEVVVGQDTVIERMMVALLTGGHLLLIGVPGIAKTLLVNAVARAVDLQFRRVQFTIDMLPSDILGLEILDQSTGKFRTHQGPAFTNLLLADEINRASPKVQSALLEAMQERKVTIGNTSYPLPVPFLVIATQNPIEQAGTFELPEAQLDRFMLCHRLTYPTPPQEEEVLRRQLKMGLKHTAGGGVPKTAFVMIVGEPVCHLGDLVGAMETVQQVHVSEVFMKHCVEFVRLTRTHSSIELGCSPRAGLALIQASQARAFVLGRDYVVPEDVFQLAEDVVLHRIRLTYEALAEGQKPARVLEELLKKLG